MDGRFAGKVALVTGGTSGIGLATALAFAMEGAQVVIAGRTQTRGEAALAQIKEAGGEAIYLQADVSDSAQVQALIATTIETYGRLDCAFNNASSGGKDGPVALIEEADWDKTMNGVLKSVWLCLKYEIGEMLKTGGGAIVNNSSVDGLHSFPFGPAYSTAKHGVVGLTKSAAVQYAAHGIRINAVCPGWVETPPVQRWIEQAPEMQDTIIAQEPIGRIGQPEEIADAVLWLCSPGASFMIGTAIPVDGGYLA